MSYIDQENGSRRVAVGGVVVLHLAIGYALISGLAFTVFHQPSPPLVVGEYPEDRTPPPLPPPPTPRAAHEDPPLAAERTPIEVPVTSGFTPTKVDTVYPTFPVDPPPVPQPSRVSHAREAIPGPSRATWVTTDDYPTGPLRDGVQGVVAIDVAVGTDGRVASCEVTASSGNDLLDQTTCRLYAKRARFQPALDADGKPTPSRHSDRIRWQIPE